MLSNPQVQVIRYTKRAYFYLRSLPVEWEISTARLNWIPTKQRLKYGSLQMPNILCLRLQAFYVKWWNSTSDQLPRYLVAIPIQHLLIGLESFAILAVVIVAMFNIGKNEIFNGFIKWRHQLYQGNLYFNNLLKYDAIYLNFQSTHS